MTSNPFLVMEGASFALDGHTVTLAIHEVFERAACIDARNDVFFDAGNQPQAKQICQTCDIRWECLSYALETGQPNGVWGGLSPMERRYLLRRSAEQLTEGSPALNGNTGARTAP